MSAYAPHDGREFRNETPTVTKEGVAPQERNTTGRAHHLGSDTINLMDSIAKKAGVGTVSDAYLNTFYGINHRGLGNTVSSNQDNSGLVFVVRPDCNLSYDNLARKRVLMPLATAQDLPPTVQRAVRLLLDPRKGQTNGPDGLKSPLVNPKNPFITILTNNLLSMSGWPDIAPETYESPEGIFKESWSMIDGVYDNNGGFTLTATFRNIQGNPILTLINAWLAYAAGLRTEGLLPYWDNVIERRLDYTSRIYHLVLDPGRRYIQAIAATGYCYPISSPMGNSFNFTGTETMMQSTEQVPITFKCHGAEYNDPISIHEFNFTVRSFDNRFRIVSYGLDGTIRLAGEVAGTLFRIPHSYLKYANYFGTPIIHPTTLELMWFVGKEDLERMGFVAEEA